MSNKVILLIIVLTTINIFASYSELTLITNYNAAPSSTSGNFKTITVDRVGGSTGAWFWKKTSNQYEYEMANYTNNTNQDHDNVDLYMNKSGLPVYDSFRIKFKIKLWHTDDYNRSDNKSEHIKVLDSADNELYDLNYDDRSAWSYFTNILVDKLQNASTSGSYAFTIRLRASSHQDNGGSLIITNIRIYGEDNQAPTISWSTFESTTETNLYPAGNILWYNGSTGDFTVKITASDTGGSSYHTTLWPNIDTWSKSSNQLECTYTINSGNPIDESKAIKGYDKAGNQSTDIYFYVRKDITPPDVSHASTSEISFIDYLFVDVNNNYKLYYCNTNGKNPTFQVNTAIVETGSGLRNITTANFDSISTWTKQIINSNCRYTITSGTSPADGYYTFTFKDNVYNRQSANFEIERDVIAPETHSIDNVFEKTGNDDTNYVHIKNSGGHYIVYYNGSSSFDQRFTVTAKAQDNGSGMGKIVFPNVLSGGSTYSATSPFSLFTKNHEYNAKGYSQEGNQYIIFYDNVNNKVHTDYFILSNDTQTPRGGLTNIKITAGSENIYLASSDTIYYRNQSNPNNAGSFEVGITNVAEITGSGAASGLLGCAYNSNITNEFTVTPNAYPHIISSPPYRFTYQFGSSAHFNDINYLYVSDKVFNIKTFSLHIYLDNSPPDQPTFIVSPYTNDTPYLSWTRPSDNGGNGGCGINRYKIFRSLHSELPNTNYEIYAITNSGPSFNFSDTSAVSPTYYYYTIKAYDNLGWGSTLLYYSCYFETNKPNISIDSPDDQTWYKHDTHDITITYTGNDADSGIDHYEWALKAKGGTTLLTNTISQSDGTHSFTISSSSIASFTNGEYTFKIFAYDKCYNKKSTAKIFYFDKIPPEISFTIDKGDDGWYNIDDNIYAQSISENDLTGNSEQNGIGNMDAGGHTLRIFKIINESGDVMNLSQWTNTFEYDNCTLPNATGPAFNSAWAGYTNCIIQYTVIDFVSNVAIYTQRVNFDSTAPVITFKKPQAYDWFRQDTVDIDVEFSISEKINTLQNNHVRYVLSNSSFSLTAYTTSTNFTILNSSINGFSDGLYSLKLICTDRALNFQKEDEYIGLDKTPPIVDSISFIENTGTNYMYISSTTPSTLYYSGTNASFSVRLYGHDDTSQLDSSYSVCNFPDIFSSADATNEMYGGAYFQHTYEIIVSHNFNGAFEISFCDKASNFKSTNIYFTKDGTHPTKVTNLDGPPSVFEDPSFTWSPSYDITGISHYIVAMGTSSNFSWSSATNYTNISGLLFIMKNTNESTNYFRVRAVDKTGLESTESDPYICVVDRSWVRIKSIELPLDNSVYNQTRDDISVKVIITNFNSYDLKWSLYASGIPQSSFDPNSDSLGTLTAQTGETNIFTIPNNLIDDDQDSSVVFFRIYVSNDNHQTIYKDTHINFDSTPPSFSISSPKAPNIYFNPTIDTIPVQTSMEHNITNISYSIHLPNSQKATNSYSQPSYGENYFFTIPNSKINGFANTSSATLYVYHQDWAANHSSMKEILVMDKAKPIMDITNIDDSTVYNNNDGRDDIFVMLLTNEENPKVLTWAIKSNSHTLVSGSTDIKNFYIDNTLIKNIHISEPLRLLVTMTDLAGNFGTNDVIIVFDETPPEINFTSPEPQTFFCPTNSDINVTFDVVNESYSFTSSWTIYNVPTGAIADHGDAGSTGSFTISNSKIIDDGEGSPIIKIFVVDSSLNTNEKALQIRFDKTRPESLYISDIVYSQNSNIFVNGNTIYYGASVAGYFTIYTRMSNTSSGIDSKLHQVVFPAIFNDTINTNINIATTVAEYNNLYYFNAGIMSNGTYKICGYDAVNNGIETTFSVINYTQPVKIVTNIFVTTNTSSSWWSAHPGAVPPLGGDAPTFYIRFKNPTNTVGLSRIYYKKDSPPTGPVDGYEVSYVNILDGFKGQENKTNIIKTTAWDGDGTQILYIWMVDNCYNSGYQNVASVTLHWDTTPPIAPPAMINAEYYTNNIYYTKDATLNLYCDTNGTGGSLFRFGAFLLTNSYNPYLGNTYSLWSTNSTQWKENLTILTCNWSLNNSFINRIFYYRVQAKDALGNSSSWTSSSYCAVCVDTEAPYPSIIEMDMYHKGTTNSVSWNPVTSDAYYGTRASGLPNKRYMIFCYTNTNNVPFLQSSFTNSTTYRFSGLTSGKSYWYKLLIIDNVHNSNWSAWAGPVIQDAEPPVIASNISIENYHNNIAISWQSAIDSLSGLKGYSIYRSESSNLGYDDGPHTWTAVKHNLGMNIHNWTNYKGYASSNPLFIENSRYYYYKIIAYDEVGNTNTSMVIGENYTNILYDTGPPEIYFIKTWVSGTLVSNSPIKNLSSPDDLVFEVCFYDVIDIVNSTPQLSYSFVGTNKYNGDDFSPVMNYNCKWSGIWTTNLRPGDTTYFTNTAVISSNTTSNLGWVVMKVSGVFDTSSHYISEYLYGFYISHTTNSYLYQELRESTLDYGFDARKITNCGFSRIFAIDTIPPARVTINTCLSKSFNQPVFSFDQSSDSLGLFSEEPYFTEISKYKIFRSPVSNSADITIAKGTNFYTITNIIQSNTLIITDSSTLSNALYYYYIEAEDLAGNVSSYTSIGRFPIYYIKDTLPVINSFSIYSNNEDFYFSISITDAESNSIQLLMEYLYENSNNWAKAELADSYNGYNPLYLATPGTPDIQWYTYYTNQYGLPVRLNHGSYDLRLTPIEYVLDYNRYITEYVTNYSLSSTNFITNNYYQTNLRIGTALLTNGISIISHQITFEKPIIKDNILTSDGDRLYFDFRFSEPTTAQIAVYDVRGIKIATIRKDLECDTSPVTLYWDGFTGDRDPSSGTYSTEQKRVGSGYYFIRITAPSIKYDEQLKVLVIN